MINIYIYYDAASVTVVAKPNQSPMYKQELGLLVFNFDPSNKKDLDYAKRKFAAKCGETRAENLLQWIISCDKCQKCGSVEIF